MSTLTVRYALSGRVIRVEGYAHPQDYPLHGEEGPVYAVFSEDPEDVHPGHFLGIVTEREIGHHPYRVFADLVVRPSPLDPQTPVEDAIEQLEASGTRGVPIIGADGSFVGVVTRSSLLESLARHERTQWQGARFLQLLAEKDYEAMRLRASALDRLNEAFRSLMRGLAEETLSERWLRDALEALATLLNARFAAIGIVDPEGTLLHFVPWGLTPEETARIGSPPRGRGLLGLVVREKQILRLEDMAEHPAHVGFPPHHPPMKTLLAVPAVHEGRIFGRVYFCEKRSGNPFTEEDEALALAYAHTLALMLAAEEEARRRRTAEAGLRLQTQRLEQVAESLRLFLEGEPCEVACGFLLRRAMHDTGSSDSILAIAADGGAYRVPVALGERWGPLASTASGPTGARGVGACATVPPGALRDLLAEVLATGKSVVAPGRPGVTPAGDVPGQAMQEEALVGVPILSGTETIGVLALRGAPCGYSGGDAEQFALFAKTVAVIHEGESLKERSSRLEEGLRQSQKFDALGRLAAGVAHDFNNVLTVILGRGEAVKRRLGGDEKGARQADELITAAETAGRLTQQLLAFARRQPASPQNLDPARMLERLEPVLRRLVGDQIDLTIRPAPQPTHVRMDPGQLDQVVLNLVVNARDAMPDGGLVAITVETVSIGPSQVGAGIVPEAGDYAALTVRDTGVGMDAETCARIFEPFFTTRGGEGGSGLGLATVYGIVKQNGGGIQVTSEPGRGSEFRVFFPCVEAPAEESSGSIRLRMPPTIAGPRS